MSKYKLKVSFTEEALKTIYAAGEKLAITKEVSGDRGSSVVWVAAAPFEENFIEWENNCQLYASRQEVQNGAIIEKLSDVEAIPALVYDFESAVFGNAHTSACVGRNEYAVQNEMSEYGTLTFGLAQAVMVNGEVQYGNPINAITLPCNHTCVMSPVEKLKVFLGGNLNNGVVVSREFSSAIEVEYRGNETEKTIAYDFAIGMFIPK